MKIGTQLFHCKLGQNNSGQIFNAGWIGGDRECTRVGDGVVGAAVGAFYPGAVQRDAGWKKAPLGHLFT